MKKRVISVFLTITMLVSVYACGKTQNIQAQPKTEETKVNSASEVLPAEETQTEESALEETVSDGNIEEVTDNTEETVEKKITSVTEYPKEIKTAKDLNNTLTLLMNHDKEYGNVSTEKSDTGYFYNIISNGTRTSQYYENVADNASVNKFYNEVQSVKKLLGDYDTIIFATTTKDVESYSIELTSGDDGALSVVSVFGQALYSEDIFKDITIGTNYDAPADYIDGYGYSGLIFYVQNDNGKNIGICLLANYNEEDDTTLSDASADASSTDETDTETE